MPNQDNAFWQSVAEIEAPPSTEIIPEPKKEENGFHWLKKGNPKLYSLFKHHLEIVLDWKDYGHYWQGAPRHHNYKETLNFFMDARNKPTRQANRKHYPNLKSLSLIKIEKHCKNLETLYYTSNPYNHWGLLLLDIDDKKGQAGIDEVLAVEQYLQTLFPNHYNQISTKGKGWHGYIIVQYPDLSVDKFRKLVKNLENALKGHIHSNFKATFEIKGYPGLMNKFGEYITLGQLAKIPRLACEADIQNYMDCSKICYAPEQLQAIIDDLTPPVVTPTLPLPYTDIDMHTKSQSVCISISVKGEKNIGNSEMWENDSCKRMNKCAWNLSMLLKRAATENEIWEAYHLQNQNTEDDEDGNRRKLCQEAASWCQQNYNPAKKDAYNPKSNLDLISQYVTDGIRGQIKQSNRSVYTSEQMAAALHVIERASLTIHKTPKNQFTVPNNSILAMFKTLNIVCEGTEISVRNKLSAMKRALVDSGLAEVLDANWDIGRGKCYALGSNHPKYQEYLTLKKSLQSPEQQIQDSLIDEEIIMLTR